MKPQTKSQVVKVYNTVFGNGTSRWYIDINGLSIDTTKQKAKMVIHACGLVTTENDVTITISSFGKTTTTYYK